MPSPVVVRAFHVRMGWEQAVVQPNEHAPRNQGAPTEGRLRQQPVIDIPRQSCGRSSAIHEENDRMNKLGTLMAGLMLGSVLAIGRDG